LQDSSHIVSNITHMKTKSFLSILALVVVVLAGGAFALSKSGTTQEVSATAVAPSSIAVTPSNQLAEANTGVAVAASSSYKDGTYTAEGDYAVPEGKIEAVTVSVTLKDGTIVDSTVTGSARDHDSRRFQQQFISGYKALVTGKSIDAAKLGTVSGASLTGAGWNAAIESIKAQAAV
jgi:uncharacterized protein with FMN-binding domain